ncbi:MAG: ATP-grasp domain-containing protein [Cyclobacteriaceae bacterium]
MKRSRNKSIVLIGYDEHILLSVAYSLKDQNRNLIVLTNKKHSACNFSRFVHQVVCFEEYSEILSKIRVLGSSKSIELVIPVGENESLEVINQLKEIEKIAKVAPLTELGMFETAIDKGQLREYLTAQGLDFMPKSVKLEGIDTYNKALELKFPVLIKPSRGSFGRGIETKINRIELEKYLGLSNCSLKGFEAQEYVEGSLVTCNIYAREGKILVHTIQESPVKNLRDYSRNDDLTFIEDEQVFEIVSSVAKSLQWEGIACFDLIRQKESGRIFLLEINGRFWASLASSLMKANVNFAEYMVKDALSGSNGTVQRKNRSQISLKTFFSNFIKLRPVSFSQTKYGYYSADPFARLVKAMNDPFKRMLCRLQVSVKKNLSFC